MDSSVFIKTKQTQIQEDIRENLEKKVLSFTVASVYEALPKLLITERGISFTQLPPIEFVDNDPAANTCVLVIDFDGENPSPEKGNYLVADSKKDFTQLFDLLYDLTNMVVVKLNITNGIHGCERNITKFLVVSPDAKMKEFYFEVTSLLKIMQGGVVDDKYNSFVLALRSNAAKKSETNQNKAKLFHLVDQSTDEERLRQSTALAIIAGKDMTKQSQKKELLKKFSFQQLQLCKNVSILEPYEIPSMDQLPSREQTIISFLLQQQNQKMMLEKSSMIDFKSPIEIDLILLRDNQMRSFKEVEFCITNEVIFKQHVTVNTVVAHPSKRFGIDQQHIQRFMQQLKELEVQGRKFRTKYQIAMTSGAPQAENFLWTILGNKETKEAGHRFHHYKPTVLHWRKFAEMTTKIKVFDKLIELSYAQTIWQFAGTMAVTKINKSTHQAKENAVMTLFHINVIRMVIVILLKSNDELFSLEFMTKMAQIIKPVVQISAFLYYLQKDRHVHLIHKMHALFCDKVVDVNFKEGIHKLIVSILAALMTQSEQAIRMYPVLMALGKVTDKLVNIFQWDENIVRTMKCEIKAKNVRLHDRGLFKEFFKFPEHFRPSDYQKSNKKMATDNGRYYRLLVSEITNVELPEHYWKNQVSEEEIHLAKMLFDHEDSDVAIITSELADLHLTNLGTSEAPKYDEEYFSNPVSHFSDIECFKRAEQNIEDDPELKRKLEEMERTLQSSNNWTEHQLHTQFRLPNLALFRFESGACVGYDWKTQQFCDEPVKEGTSRCFKHSQEGNDLKLIREMGTLVTKTGVSLAKGITRSLIRPDKLDKILEYAPSSEGAAPAFRHSMDGLERLLEACDATYKQGFLDSIPFFDDKEFKQRFPNSKSITSDTWKHAYLAMLERMKSFAFDLKANWIRNIPFMLTKVGVYQGWLNAEDIMDQKKFVSSRYNYRPLGTVADLLPDMSNRAKPIAPALLFDPKRMDGTCTPSTQSTDRNGKCWKLNTENMTFSEAMANENVYNLRNYPFSPLNAPNMGEANNLTPSMYLEPDPNHVNEYVAVVFVGQESFHNKCVQRADNVRGTRFESKNDPAWHYKDTEHFEVLRIVNNDVIQSPVQSLDELELRDSQHQVLTQDWLQRQIQHLNGQIPIGNLSSKNTHMKSQQNQRKYTLNENLEGHRDAHRQAMFHLGLLDKTMLHKIQMANHLQRFGVALFFVSTGTGPASADMRKLAALQAPIPEALFSNLERFKDIQKFFNLFSVKKDKPRYMDYLDMNANIFHLTFKPQQGRSQFERPGPYMEQPGNEYSKKEIENFEFRSEINDICSNVADLMVFRNDQYVPMVNYLVALEGNIQMISSWCHIGNSIPHYFYRPSFSVKGDKLSFPMDGPKAGATKTVFIGSIKKGAMLRPDCRLGVVKIIQDLEVDDEPAQPLKKMRYPVENGELYQAKIRERRDSLMTHLNVDYDTADTIADCEFAHLMATSTELVSGDDPSNSRAILEQYGCTDENFIQESIQFYQNCEGALIQEVPMKTFQKFRYGSGVNLELLKKKEKPDLKDFWTLNANRLTNIASQLNLKGCYSQEEEYLEIQKEKAMFQCAHEFGVMANVQPETFEFLEKAVRTSRPKSSEWDDGNSTSAMNKQEGIFLGSDVASTTHGKSKKVKIRLLPQKEDQNKLIEPDKDPLLDELVGKASDIKDFQNVNTPRVDYAQLNQRLRCTTTEEQVDDILGTPEGALGTGSIVSLIPSRKKRAPKVHKETESTSGLSSNTLNRSGYNVGRLQELNDSLEPVDLPPARQKALFRGRYFPSFGIFCPPLAGTEIFPMAPRMEKLHFAVAAEMPLDHYDGEPQQQFLDDIKEYMKPVFQSYQLSNKDRYLQRFKNKDFNDEWNTKFPFSSHRFHEGNAIRTTVGANEVFKVNLINSPDLFSDYKENINPEALSDRHGKGTKFRHNQMMVTPSPQANQREIRQIGYSASQMKVDSSDSLVNADEFGRKFEKFLSVVKKFDSKGHRELDFHHEVPMLDLLAFTTYEQFEDWLFQVKDQNENPNVVHEKLLMLVPWKDHFLDTHKLKIAGWLGTLLKFDRIKLIKSKITNWAKSFGYPMTVSQPTKWHQFFITLMLLTED